MCIGGRARRHRSPLEYSSSSSSYCRALLGLLPLTTSMTKTPNAYTSVSRLARPVKKLSYAMYARVTATACVEWCVTPSWWMTRAKPKSPSRAYVVLLVEHHVAGLDVPVQDPLAAPV